MLPKHPVTPLTTSAAIVARARRVMAPWTFHATHAEETDDETRETDRRRRGCCGLRRPGACADDRYGSAAEREPAGAHRAGPEIRPADHARGREARRRGIAR